ncbi:putative inactive 1-aminocyclopropane-1-carboxylate synthase-like protein 2 [Penicillium cataractarum]|uniref:Inactive 1-aminocyclopropane-1-carboxylate synthase-like protein 2 n=1 Tax=Penicillium cataractarum TaxID=2100454 RepID=A0A9W9VUD5_9EURO|nr:putative inactive 1-aminocyclopropane-1-carboxylate synthase-like protein 2 [Penicillium cataractarum]KAJ5389309.1 putative inactive 1-aminocyclopropane-1-carboxylate synthase-like protein 2 [Penicillium cataractarum]
MLSGRMKRSLSWLSDHASDEQTHPKGVLEMDKAENWLVRPDILPIIKEAVSLNLKKQDLSYSQGLGGPPELLNASASFFNRFFTPHVAVLPEHIVTSTGCASILETLIFSICDAGDGLLLETPMWDGFAVTSMLRNNVQIFPVKYSTRPTNAADLIRHYSEAMKNATCPIRGLIVCNPHNPLGQIYPTIWLEALLQFCEGHNIHFISDEIYALSNFGEIAMRYSLDVSNPDVMIGLETKFTSVLAIDLKRLKVDHARVHIAYSISKDLGSSGVRLGYLVTQSNPRLRHTLAVLNRFKVCNVASIAVASLFSNLHTLESILVRGKSRLRIAAEMVGNFMLFHKIAFYSPVAGCFMWVRIGGELATKETDAALFEKFEAAGVAVAAGSKFNGGEPGWFRLTFALPRDNLIEGLRRIEIAMEANRHWIPEKSQL